MRPRVSTCRAIPPSTTPKPIRCIVSVGYGTGPEVAERLEENNIIVNYQATPDEEGFTASGALRMGVSEMTRFGFGQTEFDELAELMADCILRGKDVSEDVARLRSRSHHRCTTASTARSSRRRWSSFTGADRLLSPSSTPSVHAIQVT